MVPATPTPTNACVELFHAQLVAIFTPVLAPNACTTTNVQTTELATLDPALNAAMTTIAEMQATVMVFAPISHALLVDLVAHQESAMLTQQVAQNVLGTQIARTQPNQSVTHSVVSVVNACMTISAPTTQRDNTAHQTKPVLNAMLISLAEIIPIVLPPVLTINAEQEVLSATAHPFVS